MLFILLLFSIDTFASSISFLSQSVMAARVDLRNEAAACLWQVLGENLAPL